MKSRQKTAFYPLIWVVVGISIVAVGFFLHNGFGWLFFFIGLLVTLATLFVWSAMAIQRIPQSSSQANPPEENETTKEEAPELAPLSGGPSSPSLGSGNAGIPSPMLPENGSALPPVLQLRINEKPLSVQHLLATLSTLLSLYVKLWLLQRERFEDFAHYTKDKDPYIEEGAALLIAELEYHSLDMKINIDLSLEGVIKAFQMLCDMVFDRKERKHLKESEVIKAYLDNLEQIFGLIEKLTPEQKDVVLQSLTSDILRLARDETLEIISLLLPHRDLSANGGRGVISVSDLLGDPEAEAQRRKLAQVLVGTH